jgi:ribonuclease HII
MMKKMMKKLRYTIGIDEVGRGALAGPVVVAAVATIVNLKSKIKNLKLKLRDSKKLTPRQREIWFHYITQMNADIDADKRRCIRINQRRNLRQSAICYALANVSPKVIDKINISNAANLAATRALSKLVKYFTIVKYLTKSKVEVFLDGGLYLNKIRVNPCLPARFAGASARRAGRRVSNPHISASTITKGDEKIPAIMLASIVAKVTRDRMMVKLHKKYPKYAFDRHKGYGTKKHLRAIKKYGRLPIHRKSFKIK